MAIIAQKVPVRIREAIEQEKLSEHHIIYYDIEHGWVCQQRDDAFINSISTTVENDSATKHPSEAHPLEELGPFGVRPTEVSLSIIGDTNMYQTTVDQRLNRLNLVDGYGQHAPMAPITLTGRARDVAYIPHNATHFCWIYPPIGVTQLKQKKKAKLEQEIVNGNLEYTFLALGGFAYFRFEENSYRILQTNCLVQADNGLTFEGPFQWHSDYTAHLAKQGRFQSATISSLLELGIKYYCFINPSEKLKSSKSDSPDWIPAPNGGFIYLYSSKLTPHTYDRYFAITDKPRSEKISTRIMPFSLIHKRNQPQTVYTTISNTSSGDTNNKFLCSICMERTIRCMFIPCKHMCTCNECAEKIRRRNNSVCPICRQVFREVWDVFL